MLSKQITHFVRKEIVMSKSKMMIPILIAVFLDICLGICLKVSYSHLFWVIFKSSLFDLLAFLFINKGLAVTFTREEVFSRFKICFKKTSWIQMLAWLYFIIRLYMGLNAKPILFYGNILIGFYVFIYILCMCDIDVE